MLQNTNGAATRYRSYTSPSRETGGDIPDMILPGVQSFIAWYGVWEDRNGNGHIDLDVVVKTTSGSFDHYGPTNEFVKVGGDLYAFIDPGSHPTSQVESRPGVSDPDFKYNSAGDSRSQLWSTNGNVAFIDGSLLEPYTMESVSDPILVPDDNTNRPYTAKPTSRIDIDHYISPLPGFATTLYQATAATTVREVSSPSAGSCPNNCVFPPFPVAPPGDVLEDVYAPYEYELGEGPNAWASGRLADFVADYRAWVDALPGITHPNFGVNPLKKNYPMPAVGESGGMGMPPGWFHLEGRSGVWKDRNGDGWVGIVDNTNPYQGGNQPQPNNYGDSRGEYIAKQARGNAQNPMRILLIPETDWGEGVHVFSSSGLPQNNCSPAPCANYDLGLRTGSDPISLGISTSSEGYFGGNALVFFPRGNVMGGFWACIENAGLSYQSAGADVTEFVSDCDYIERYAP